MYKVTDISGYPLSPALTYRVVNYLNYFRLFVSVALGIAYLAGGLVAAETLQNSSLAGAVLMVYFVFSLYFVFAARRKDDAFYHLALQSLVLDVLLISLLLFTFEGVAVLLVFVGASAGIILPLRLALLVASLAAVAIIVQPLLIGLGGAVSTGRMLASGFYGITILVITVLTHLLANWARDFRLIAERQAQTVSRLEQVNELIIRRLRSGVLAVGTDGKIRMMNESAWFLLGSPPASERTLSQLSPELRIALEEWRNDPRLEPRTLALNASQAEVVPKFVNLPGGRDISTIIFLEDNDVVSQRALEMSSISLAKLSTSIAHEIRNPLSAISHAAQLLGEEEGMDEGQERLVDIIRKQSKRMNGIIENILQMSRREKSQVELLQLEPWLQELLAEFQGAYTESRFELQLPGGDGTVTILFDRSQLHQVLWKLMENALQHLGKDNATPLLALHLEVERDSGYCILSVEDNGKGIPEDKVGQIFEPFYTTRKEGTGLGLYIARQLCEANQAELTVESRPGQGTRFRIRMALASGSMAQEFDLEGFAPQPLRKPA